MAAFARPNASCPRGSAASRRVASLFAMAFVSCATDMLPTRSPLIAMGQSFHKNERGDSFIRLFLSFSYQGAAISKSRGDRFGRQPKTKKIGAFTAYRSRRF